MQLHIFEENERCVKIDVRQNTLLEDIYKRELGNLKAIYHIPPLRQNVDFGLFFRSEI